MSGPRVVIFTSTGPAELQPGPMRMPIAGARVTASTDIEFKHNEFVGNPEGIDFQAGSIGNTVKENVFRDSTTRGIMLRTFEM